MEAAQVPRLNGITVCVDYADRLAITLPWNAQHFGRVVVVTTAADQATHAVVDAVSNASCFLTDAFYRHGANFNKGLAVEEGFDALGREGWIVVWDADTLMPARMDLGPIKSGHLYAPARRMCPDVRPVPESEWSQFPIHPDFDWGEWGGYFQLFHADDPVLADRPWYGIAWRHAGGCDSEFAFKWPAGRLRRIRTFEVCHLGEPGVNWCGRGQAKAARRYAEGREAAGYGPELIPELLTGREQIDHRGARRAT